jgi:hypothetical protein
VRFWWALPLVVVACSSGSNSSAPSQCADAQALVAASDYSSSAVGAMSTDGSEALRGAADLGGDPALAVSRGRAFFVARDQDAIFEIDPRCGLPKAKWSAHDPAHKGSSNPQDVAVAPDGSLWVPRYNVPSIAILDASGAIVKTIDLSPYDDDGNPNASAIVIADVGGAAKAFVTLERLDDANGLRSTRPSALLRVDVASEAVEAQIALVGRNPFSVFVDGGALWVAAPGNFDTLDEAAAGIERVDLSTSTTKLVVSEHDLGGSVSQVAVTNGCGAAIVADASTANRTALVTFDPDAGRALTTASAPVLATDGFDLSALAWVNVNGETLLLVGDRRAASGGYPVHVFDAAACALHERAAVLLSQKPVALRTVP